MATVYSKRLLVSHAGATVEVGPDESHLWVVRWLTAFNASVVANGAYNLVLYPADATVAWGLIAQQAIDIEATSKSVELRVVVYPGETVKWFADGGIDGSVSGFELLLP